MQTLKDQLKQFRKSLDGQYSGQLPKAATHIEQDLLAIIGEDEQVTSIDRKTDNDNAKEVRNSFRAELRTAIMAYCKGETI